LADVIWEGDMWEEDFILFSVSMWTFDANGSMLCWYCKRNWVQTW
jgi:hypothetical protein